MRAKSGEDELADTPTTVSAAIVYQDPWAGGLWVRVKRQKLYFGLAKKFAQVFL